MSSVDDDPSRPAAPEAVVTAGPPVPDAAARPFLLRLRRNLAVQDYVVLAFHAYLLGFCLLAGDVARRSQLVGAGLLGVTALAVLLVRGEVLPAGRLRALVYRLAIVLPVPATYSLFRDTVPAIEHRLLDAQLLAADRLLFGVTPAVAMEPWKSSGVVEWFSTFYFGYYPLLILHVVGSMFLDRGRRLHEMMFGAMAIVCVGHVFYTLVPALGPQFAMEFPRELTGGFFWDRVHDTVHGSGARIDVFPSLHTALPTFFALHSLRYRRTWPYRYTWPITAFVVAQIMVATLLLRWHYGVDVVAGVLLAVLAQQVALRVSGVEDLRGEASRQPVWEPLRA